MRLVFVLILSAVAVGVVVAVRSRATSKSFEILPAHEMQKKYGLYAENRENIEIDPVNVPENLRDLIPMAQKWGVGDDIIRTDLEGKATEAEKNEFTQMLRGRTDDVTAWLDSFDNDANQMPDDAVPFMYMLEALDESGLWPE